MTHRRMVVRRPIVLGLLVGGLLLVVLGAVLAAAGGIFAVAGVAGGGAVVALLALLRLARVDPPATIGTARLLAAQAVVLAALVTGVALAVFGHAEDAARLAGGALAAIAVALDCLIITVWWHDRRNSR